MFIDNISQFFKLLSVLDSAQCNTLHFKPYTNICQNYNNYISKISTMRDWAAKKSTIILFCAINQTMVKSISTVILMKSQKLDVAPLL